MVATAFFNNINRVKSVFYTLNPVFILIQILKIIIVKKIGLVIKPPPEAIL
jgi:hypothetical protein